MTKDLNLEAVNSVLSREVKKLQEELRKADKLAMLGRTMRRLQAESLSHRQLGIELQANLKKAEDAFDDALNGADPHGH